MSNGYRRLALCLAPLALLVAGAAPAGAACPVPNGTFDTDVAGWSNSFFVAGIGNPPGSNGSNPDTPNGCVPVSTCIPFTAGETCTLSAQVFFPAGEPVDGIGILRYAFYSDATCTPAGFLSSSPDVSASSAVQNSWVPLTTGPVTAPVGTVATRVVGLACSGPSGGVDGYFDNFVSVASGGPAPPPPAIPAIDRQGLALLVLVMAAAGIGALGRRG